MSETRRIYDNNPSVIMLSRSHIQGTVDSRGKENTAPGWEPRAPPLHKLIKFSPLTWSVTAASAGVSAGGSPLRYMPSKSELTYSGPDRVLKGSEIFKGRLY